MTEAGYKQIDIQENQLSFEADGKTHTFSRTRLPKEFKDWMIDGRRAMYEMLEGNEGHAGFFGTHLPVVVTHSRHDPMPFNTGNKGVGLIPVPEKIDDYCKRYQETFETYAHQPWEESLKGRLDCVREFINGDAVSDEVLITLEIFERTTFANLCDYPVATLHFTGEGPVYKSYQINAVVQVVNEEHPIYQFAFLSRQLFEYDTFHITQTQFPYAYVFYPVEVSNKTPFPRREGLEGFQIPKEWSHMDLNWDKDVLEQLIRAPAMIQQYIIKVTEEYARTNGHSTVNLPMFNAIRSRYMGGKANRPKV